jgi:hypothetical protein
MGAAPLGRPPISTSVWQTPWDGVRLFGIYSWRKRRVLGLTEATMSMSNSPSPGFLTLTSSIFQPPFARVSRQTMALALVEDMLLLDV